MKKLKERKTKPDLNEEIEILREQLHRQKDITNSDALRISAKLDLLILKVMTESNKQF